MRILTFLLFFLFSFLSGFAQRYTFQVFSTAQGLPQTQVTSIIQDQQGYLWVGTLGGLSRFNGKDFDTYTTESGLLNNRITFLTFIDNELWIGHEGGVSRMTGNRFEKFSLAQKDKKTKVTDIVKFKGYIVVATNGAGIFNLENERLTAINLPEPDFERVRDMSLVDGQLWLATRAGLLITADLNKFVISSNLKDYNLSYLVCEKEGVLATTYNDGLLEIKGLSTPIKKRVVPGDPESIRFAYTDRQGRIWLNTFEGMVRINNDGTYLKLYESNGLPINGVMAMYEDRAGDIWFGSEGKGLIRFTGEQFIYYNQASGLSSDLVLSVNQDRSGSFWFGTYDKGLVKMSANGQFTNFLFQNNTVWTSLIDVDGLNWFGTGYGLVSMRNDKIVKTYFYDDGLPGDKITALLKLSNGSFLVGGSDGVSIYRDGVFKRLNTTQTETVRDFCRVNGKIYCASDKGLFLYEGDNLTLTGKLNLTVYSLTRDDAGRIWIGTEEGLYLLENEKVRQFMLTSGTTSNPINFVKHQNGQVFVGTNNGLFSILTKPSGKHEVIKYGISDGVIDLETNINSAFVDQKGRLWFGTASGLACYRPRFAVENSTLPGIVLKRVLVNFSEEEGLKFTKSYSKLGQPSILELPFTRNNILFEIDGVSLADHDGLRYQYRLDGLGSGWSPLGTNTTIAFSSLPAGNYTFFARCVDTDGKVSEIIQVEFRISPAFYRTWWFIALSVLFVLLVLLLLFQLRLRRVREQNEKEKLEFKSRLLTLEQRSLNASMNRHFIFNSLNSIQYFINTQDRLSANRFLTNFAKLIRKNLDSSEEGNMVTLEQELERLDLYLSLESMRFKDRFVYVIHCDDSIEKENIVIPAMILQPFVENSIIHGILPNEDKKGKVEIYIKNQGDIMEIQIKDNGIGIDNSRKIKQQFEGDHKSQGMDITTKRIELLNRLSEKHFEIIGPRQIEDNNHSINGTEVILKISIQNLED